MLLDRFGPRRIEAALLIVAATGALVFANATSLPGLVLGRGLIGFGVSACLMAAFKAFAIWFPKQQLPQINGFQMAAGGLGALVATSPVEAALNITDWRGLFTVLAVLTLAVAAAIFFIVPERRTVNEDQRFVEQMRGIHTVVTSLTFWRIAPWATLSQATFLSIHGLWAGPWLRDVAGFDRTTVAGTLLLLAVAMIAGFVLLGTVAERLSRRGIPTMAVAVIGMGVFMGVLLMIVFQFSQWSALLWILFGFFWYGRHLALCRSFPELSFAFIREGQHGAQPVGVCGCLWGPVGHRGHYRSMADHGSGGLCAIRLSGRFQYHAGFTVDHSFLVLACRGNFAPPS